MTNISPCIKNDDIIIDGKRYDGTDLYELMKYEFHEIFL